MGLDRHLLLPAPARRSSAMQLSSSGSCAGQLPSPSGPLWPSTLCITRHSRQSIGLPPLPSCRSQLQPEWHPATTRSTPWQPTAGVDSGLGGFDRLLLRSPRHKQMPLQLPPPPLAGEGHEEVARRSHRQRCHSMICLLESCLPARKACFWWSAAGAPQEAAPLRASESYRRGALQTLGSCSLRCSPARTSMATRWSQLNLSWPSRWWLLTSPPGCCRLGPAWFGPG